MLEDSLKKRYAYKLTSNLISFGINIIIQAIVPRGLGPKSYGDFSFLTVFFQQITNFFDLWTTPSFYIKLSQRPREFGLIPFTFYFVGISSIILLSILIFISPESSLYKNIWPHQDIDFLILAAVWSIAVWILQLVNNMSDAFGLTVKSEKGRAVQKIIGLIIILVLFFLNKLNLTSYFFFHYITMFFLIGFYVWMMERNGYPIIKDWRIPFQKVKNYTHEFFNYSHPLFLTGIVGLFAGILDRWLLQFYGGSVEQGFYGLSYQIGIVCFLFSGAMSPLIMREFSVAYNQKNIRHIAYLFRKYIPLLYSLAAFISCFLSVQAEKVVYIMGGKDYTNAAVAVAVMSFYPIHQTYGQLSGSVFLATGQTGLYGKIGVFFMVVGLPLTYLFIAPSSQLGINAGAAGLAIKMVLIQIISVNVQLYFNAKFLNLNFWKYLGHQLVSVICLILISQFSMFIVDKALHFGDNIIFNFLIGGILYCVMVLILIYFQPRIFGLGEKDVTKLFNLLINRLRSIHK